MPRKRQPCLKSRWQDEADGRWYGRIRINLPNGKQKDVSRVAINKTHAPQVADELEAIFLAGGVEAVDATSMTVAELVALEQARKKKEEEK